MIDNPNIKFCEKHNINYVELKCPICKKEKAKQIKNWSIAFFVIIILFGGAIMFLYSKMMDDINNPIKVYEAKCEEGQDYCFKGDRIKTTTINPVYKDLLRTCDCQKCYEKDINNPTRFNSLKTCKLVKAEDYMQCEEFVCSNKFVVKFE